MREVHKSQNHAYTEYMALPRKGILRRGVVTAVLGIAVLLIGTSAASAASARPDLVSSAPNLTPNRVTAGGNVSASSTIRNKGKRTAGKSITIFYVSVDDKLDKSDVLTGGFKTPRLKPGKSKTGKFSFKIPVDFPPFTYRILSCADAVKGIREKVEKNNCTASLLSIKKGTGVVTPPVTPPVVTPPADADGDGIVDGSDNCPSNANADQADADSDAKGDVCDPCPSQANPGATNCIVTAYSIKNGTTASGTSVRVTGLLVTARKGTRVWAQIPVGDPAYTVPSYSGIEITFATAPAISAGDTLTADGTVTANQKLSASSFTVTSTGSAPPAALVVTAAQLDTNSAAYDSLLTRIDTATYVSAYNVDHWLLTDGSQFTALDTIIGTLPAQVAAYDSITGIATDDGTHVGLMPRTLADIVEAP